MHILVFTITALLAVISHAQKDALMACQTLAESRLTDSSSTSERKALSGRNSTISASNLVHSKKISRNKVLLFKPHDQTWPDRLAATPGVRAQQV